MSDTGQVQSPPELEREGKKQKGEKHKGEKGGKEKEKGEKEKGGNQNENLDVLVDQQLHKINETKQLLVEVGNKRKAIRELLDDTIAAVNVSVTELVVKIDAMEQVQDNYNKKKKPLSADVTKVWNHVLTTSKNCAEGIDTLKTASIEMKTKCKEKITFPNIESFAVCINNFEELDKTFKEKASTAQTSWNEMRTMCDKMMDVYEEFLMKPAK
jgi:gamma-glutamylcyclotransferase (GGCT)/AIG2-like uncharacterized protein YtfP